MNIIKKAATLATTAFFLAAPSQVMAQTYYTNAYTTTPGNAAAGMAAAGVGSIFSILFSCFYCLLCTVPFILLIALAIYVYNDAVKYNVDTPILWALVTFFFPVVGLLIYFLAIRADAIKAMEAKKNPVPESVEVESRPVEHKAHKKTEDGSVKSEV